MNVNKNQTPHLLKVLTDVGIALSVEKDRNNVLEIILQQALNITHTDGGTLYICTEEKELKFEILVNKSMGIHLEGKSNNPIVFDNLPLYDKENKPNKQMLAPWAAVSRKTINIKDAYNDHEFDLSGTKEFDAKTGYHSHSFLTVPMTNHQDEVIGVLQLINVIEHNKIVPFSPLDQSVAESLASQAAVIITNRQLIKAQKDLFDALIQPGYH